MTRTYNYYYRLYYNIQERLKLPTYQGKGCEFTNWQELRDYLLDTIGEKPDGLTLDRVNNNLGYVRGNLRWATRKQQIENRCEMPARVEYKWTTKNRYGYTARVKHKGITYYAGHSPSQASAYLKALAMKSFFN